MICWYDIETDGLDVENGHLLELGYVLTDDDFNVRAERSLVIGWGDDLRFIRAGAPEVVQKMHDDNGLWDECAKSDLTVDEALVLFRSDLEVFRHGSTAKWAQGGSGVSHFDSQWLRRHAPGLFDDLLTYWAYDVGPVRRMYLKLGLDASKAPRQSDHHRAWSDARVAMEQWRWLESKMRCGS
jgi:oligoribonuclease (3'-5' exoribonuclease)